jgi:lipid-A-disaccharide synthase
LLPGSRDTEIQSHLDAQLGAARWLIQRARIGSAEVIIAADTPSDVQRQIAARAAAYRVGVTRWSPHVLESFDVAAVASGTATLDCMAAGVPIVIGYRTDWLTFSIATRAVTTPWIGLPNLVLGKATFPELVQSQFNVDSLARHLDLVLTHHRQYSARVADVQRTFAGYGPNGDHAASPAARVASLMTDWL